MALTGTFDLFVLLVEYVAGSILLSLFLWAFVLLITGILGRMSFPTILVVLGVFFAVSMVGYVGALAAVPLFLLSTWYMVVGVINYLSSMR